MFQGEMDPEIAALLGGGTSDSSAAPTDTAPSYSTLFDEPLELDEDKPSEAELDLNAEGFPEITKRYEDKPSPAFSDPNFYKIALSGEGDIAQRVHNIIQKYVGTKDPKDKGVYRQQATTAFWDFMAIVARKAPGKMIDAKKFLLRFFMLHPTFLTQEHRDFFAKLLINSDLNQPVYYLDEWLKAVGTGVIRISQTDEVRVAKASASSKLQALLDKANGKKDGARSLLKAKDEERMNFEHILRERIKDLADHYPLDGLPDVNSCYTDVQKKIFTEVHELLKNLLKTDHELDMYLRDFYQAENDVKVLEGKIRDEGGGEEIDMGAVDTEFNTVRQMVKMTIGRQGNHFPVLTSEYFRCGPNDTATRENVLTILARIESIGTAIIPATCQKEGRFFIILSS
jgi:hypothetical protein